MTRPARIALKIAGTIVFLALLAVVVIKVVFTKERVLAILEPQIEARINRPVTIGDAGITLWNGIGVRLEAVSVGNPPDFDPVPMLQLAALDIKARFWPLLIGHVVIDRIELHQPIASIEYLPNGRSNFEGMLKKDTVATPPDRPDTDGPTVRLLLIRGARVAWRDREEERDIDLYGGDVEIDFEGSSTASPVFAATLLFDSLYFSRDESRLAIRGGRPSLFATGQWERLTRTLRLDSTFAEWWGAKMSGQGQIQFLPGLYEIGFNARLVSARVEELVKESESALPLSKLSDMTGAIDGRIEAQFRWPLADGAVPEWQGRFELTDVRWPLPQTGAVVTIPRVELAGDGRSISWSAVSGQVTGGTFSTTGAIGGLFSDEKTISAKVQADMPLEGTRGLFPEEWKLDLAGDLNLDLSGFGSIKNWQDMNLNGAIRSERLMVADEDWDFDSVSLSLNCALQGDALSLSHLDFIAGNSRGKMEGRIDRLVPAMLSGFRSRDIPRGRLTINSPYLDLDNLLGNETVEAAGDSLRAATSRMPLVSLAGTLHADTVIYNGMSITEANSPFEVSGRVFTVSRIDGRVYGGTLSGTLDWDVNPWPRPEFSTNLRASGIEANDFLTRYLNWSGGVFGKIALGGEFTGRGRHAEEILPNLSALARVDVASIRLEASPLLAAVGRAIGIPDMNRPITIEDYGLPFRIENARLYTDHLWLIVGDVRYDASGSFGFDRTLSYDVTATALSSRVPRALQGTGLRFDLTGTVSKPQVTINTEGTIRPVIDTLISRARDTLQLELDSIMQRTRDSLGRRIEDVLDDILKPKKP